MYERLLIMKTEVIRQKIKKTKKKLCANSGMLCRGMLTHTQNTYHHLHPAHHHYSHLNS